MRLGVLLAFILICTATHANERISKAELEEFFRSNKCEGVSPTALHSLVKKLNDDGKALYEKLETLTERAGQLSLRRSIPKSLRPEQSLLLTEIRSAIAESKRQQNLLLSAYDSMSRSYDKLVRQKKGQTSDADEALADCAEYAASLQILLKFTSERILNPSWEIAIRVAPMKVPFEARK